MGAPKWYLAYDEKTKRPYYYNDVGDVSYERPPGVRPPSEQQQRQVRKKSWLGGSHVQGLINEAEKKGKGESSNWFQNRLTNRQNPAIPNAGIGEKRGTVLRALYGHVAKYEDELTIRKDDILIGIEKVEGGSWWLAELRGKRGHVPGNYVEVVPESELPRKPSRRKQSRMSNYGASSFSWFQAQAEAPPKPPPKPPKLQEAQKPRLKTALLKDQKKISGRNTLKYTYWAHNWGYAYATAATVLGIAAILWHSASSKAGFGSEERELLGTKVAWVGPINLVFGLASFAFEIQYGLRKNPDNYAAFYELWYRGMMYFVFSIFGFFSHATILASVIGLITSGVNFLAEYYEERGEGKPQRYIPRYTFQKVAEWTPAENYIMTFYIILMLGLFIGRYAEISALRNECIQTRGEDICLTWAAPFAKGFGTQLDVVCALILLPVLRATIAKISRWEIAPRKTLASVIPMKKALTFHKVIGYTIAFASAGHTIAHMINFAGAPEASINAFGAHALWTGGGITLGMLIIFTAAHTSVRRAKFEVFWWSHHAFLVVFPLLLAHGPKFWYIAAIFLPAYTLDRVMRAKRGTNTMYVDYVRYSHPVLKLHFFPERLEQFKFQAGQYLFIQVPHINTYEWHPFTISSSWGDLEQDGFVSLHIRVQGKGSWTWNVKEYFKLLSGAGNLQSDGKKEPGFEKYFTHFDASGVVQRGKHIGVDGKPLIRIDGPHAAPAQIYALYEDVMLVGSGIGLTPSAAILSAVTRHKWRKGFSPETLRFYWVVRHSEVESFEWFIELLVNITKRVLSDRKAGAITDHHRLQINIYVTSTPSTTEVVRQLDPVKSMAKNELEEAKKGITSTKEAGMLDVDIGFDINSLKSLLKNPTVSTKEQMDLQLRSYDGRRRLPNRLGDIWVWNGRPEWKQIFETVRDSRLAGVRTIGVTYCGAPIIAKNLAEQCSRFTDVDCEFVLNKEVF